MQEVVDDDWPHRIQFEIALTAREGHGGVIPMTWMAIITIASHCVGLTLPGMIDDLAHCPATSTRQGRSADPRQASAYRWRPSSVPPPTRAGRHARAPWDRVSLAP